MSLVDWYSGKAEPEPSPAPKPQKEQTPPLVDWFAGKANNVSAPTAQTVQAAPQQPQELPEGAKSFDPYGNPYFGEGISGILKKWRYNFTKDVKEVSDTEWDDLRERWQASMQAQKQAGRINPAQMTEEQKAVGQEQLKVVGEAVSKTWQAGQAQGSLLSPILKATGASVTAIGELFSIPAQKLEQGLGAANAFRDVAGELESPLPKLDGLGQALVYGMPIAGLAYDFTRIALSPQEDKWDKVGKAIEEGWQSGRIFYSTLFDTTLKEKFLQEYREGKDPALIAMKLQNPLAELGGQLVLDPLNLAGAFAKASKTAKELEAAMEAVTESGVLKSVTGKNALKAIQEATDNTRAVRALDDLAKAQTEVVEGIAKNSKLLNVGYSADSLTTTSRQNAIVTKGKQLLGNMALVLKERGLSYDGIAEGILSGIRSVSGNADEMRKGLAGLSKLPNANMWLADDYVESFVVLHRMMSDADGVVSGAKLRNLTKIKNPTQFAEEATRLYLSASKGQYKEVSQMAEAAKLAKQAEKTGGVVGEETLALAKQYEQLPNHVKILDKINNVLHRAEDPINRVLFPAYFNLQGGVAVRNVVSNNELILLDKGPSAWFKDGKYWSAEKISGYLTDLYGMLPESAHGFKSLVSSMTDRPAWGFGKLMEWGEESAAMRVVGASVRDTIKKMLPKAMPDLAKHIEAGTLTERQGRKLLSLLEKNNLNLTKALEEFRDFYKVGSVEDWRNLDFVSDFEKEGLEGLDLWQEIQDLAHRGAASRDEVEEVFTKLKRVIDERAKLAAKDLPGLSPDHPGVESWGDLAKAAEEGHLDPDQQQVFTAIMESAEQARMEYQTLLDEVALKAQQALNLEGNAPGAMKLGQEMNRVRDVLRRAAPATSKAAYEVTQDAWRWSDEIKALKKPDMKELASYWTRAGLEGQIPLDLDKKSLLKAIWENRFQKVSELWNGALDAVVGESETVLKQMEGVIDTTEVQSMATNARYITQKAQAYRQAIFQGGALKIMPARDVEFVAKQYGVTTEEILQAINNKGGTQYTSIDDLPTTEVMGVIKQARQEKGLSTNIDELRNLVEPQGIEIPPPHPTGTEPSAALAWNESAKGAKYVLDNIKNQILERWGKTNPERVPNTAMNSVLEEISKTLEPRIGEMKAVALRYAKKQRDFTLLDYGEKTYGDIIKAHILPFHFFYSHSYKNWPHRIAQNPQIISHYAAYKEYLEAENKDLPDWYKQQLNINPFAGNQNLDGKSFLGIPANHPLYINLEATLNPLYGLTGTDYNDPVKRNNAMLATIDDMSKFGPTMYAPIQLGIAAMLFRDGETDVAARWAGRLFPETTQIKALTSTLFGRPVELDPAVNFFSGGIDSQERGRMSYAAAQLIQSGQFTPEQIMMDFQKQEGAAWDASYQMAIQSRAASSFTSYFLGVGFKPRSTNDIQVEQMYTDLNKLYAMSDMMDPEKYRMAWEQLRAKYPDGFVDTVLLSRKGGEKRDAALAYEVLNRIPPGNMSEALATIGLSHDEIDKFYKSKGFADPNAKFTKQEKDRFMSAVIDLAAMLKIPSAATRGQWAEARTTYSQVYKDIEKELGEDIWDKVSLYYDLKDDNREKSQQYAMLHPEIFQAMQMKREAVLSTPVLGAYYGSIETVEVYLDGKIRQELSNKYGPSIYEVQNGYYAASNPRGYLAQHPELKRFWNEKRALEAQYEPMFYQFASQLPEGIAAEFQEGFTPQSYTQEQLYSALQPEEKIPSWEEVSTGMPEWFQSEIANYAQTGQPLSKRAQKELDYLADAGGYYDGQSLLRMAVLSMQQPLAQPPGTSGGVNTQPTLTDWYNQ